MLFSFECEAAGALSARHSLRPLISERPTNIQNSGEIAPRDRGGVFAVIARSEATKQSILSLRGAMDCFAEPVIGRAFARPVGSQ
jgi:hypothetical protein